MKGVSSELWQLSGELQAEHFPEMLRTQQKWTVMRLYHSQVRFCNLQLIWAALCSADENTCAASIRRSVRPYVPPHSKVHGTSSKEQTSLPLGAKRFVIIWPRALARLKCSAEVIRCSPARTHSFPYAVPTGITLKQSFQTCDRVLVSPSGGSCFGM